MNIKIGTNNRITFPKLFCEENNINYGDEFELDFKYGAIILKPLNKDINLDELISDGTNIEVVDKKEDINLVNSNRQEILDKNNTISSNNKQLEGTKLSTSVNIIENKDSNKECLELEYEVEEDEEDIDDEEDIEENTNIIIDYKNLPENFKELIQIPLNSQSNYKPNLIQSVNAYRKCYSKCGLICKTKPKYVDNYCSECKGDMIDISVRSKYCPFYIINDNSSNIKDNNLTTFSNINNNSTKLKNLSDNRNKEIISEIKRNTLILDKDIDKKINEIKEENKVTKDININKEVSSYSNYNDLTSIKIISYSHHHQCYNCEEYNTFGFIIDDMHFYCRRCASQLFKEYMKERGKLKNV